MQLEITTGSFFTKFHITTDTSINGLRWFLSMMFEFVPHEIKILCVSELGLSENEGITKLPENKISNIDILQQPLKLNTSYQCILGDNVYLATVKEIDTTYCSMCNKENNLCALPCACFGFCSNCIKNSNICPICITEHTILNDKIKKYPFYEIGTDWYKSRYECKTK